MSHRSLNLAASGASALSDADPVLVKGLLLLQSSSNESTVAMRDLLQEAINMRHGNRRPVKPLPLLGHHEPKTKDHEALHKISKAESVMKNMSPMAESVDSDTSTETSDDIGMEILDEDVSCAVCRGPSLASWNQLIECSECHSFYHKECHSPPITEDITDPRIVWYCRSCNKSLKPKSSSSSSSSSSNAPSSSGFSKSSTSGKASSVRTSSSPPVLPFSSKPFGGKRPVGSKPSSSVNTAKLHTPSINIISADKRLQIMKKKAARKQDKRSSSK